MVVQNFKYIFFVRVQNRAGLIVEICLVESIVLRGSDFDHRDCYVARVAFARLRCTAKAFSHFDNDKRWVRYERRMNIRSLRRRCLSSGFLQAARDIVPVQNHRSCLRKVKQGWWVCANHSVDWTAWKRTSGTSGFWKSERKLEGERARKRVHDRWKHRWVRYIVNDYNMEFVLTTVGQLNQLLETGQKCNCIF